MRPRLGVNVDHVATVRQARRTDYPDPVEAALLAEAAGADQITVRGGSAAEKFSVWPGRLTAC